MANKNSLSSAATSAVKNNPFTFLKALFNAFFLNKHEVNGKTVKGADADKD